MVAFSNSFFSSLIAAAVLSAGCADAAPWPLHARHATHRTRHIGKRALKVESYHPKSTFKTFGDEGATVPSSLTGSANLIRTVDFYRMS